MRDLLINSGAKRGEGARRAPVAFLLLVLLAAMLLLTSCGESPALRTVPSIEGCDIESAERLLRKAGFELRIVGSGFGCGERESVVWQSVPEGGKAPKGSAICVRLVRAADDMTYMDGELAASLLSQQGTAVKLKYRRDSLAADGLVTEVKYSGSGAVLYISESREITAPDMTAMSSGKARKTAQELGLICRFVPVEADGKPGTVVSQSPAAGSALHRGDEIVCKVAAVGELPQLASLEPSDGGAVELTVGQTVWLSFSSLPPCGGDKLEWSSSDSAVAEVFADGSVRGISAGTAEITVSANGLSAVFSVSVSSDAVCVEMTSVPKKIWYVSEPFFPEGTGAAAILPDGTAVDASDSLTFDSDITSAAGEYRVFASCGEAESLRICYDITVVEPQLTLDVSEAIVGVTEIWTLHPETVPSFAQVTYSSSDPAIAAVSDDGVISGISAGECVVTASVGGRVSAACNVSVREKIVYLTFDDAPSGFTNQVLSTLKKYDVKATFFCIGKTGERYEPLYKRIVEEGHAIGLHSYSHSYDKCYASADSFMAETQKLSDLIYRNTGVRTKLVRFPGGTNNGVSDSRIMHEIVDRVVEEGYYYFDWSALANEVELGDNAEATAANLLFTCSKPIEIVLCHEYSSTPKMLDIVIPKLKYRGYTFKVLSEDAPAMRYEVREK